MNAVVTPSLLDLARSCRRSPRAVLSYAWSATPPQVMASLTAVTLAEMLAVLPRRLSAALRWPLRLRFGPGWSDVPVFAAALRMGGTLQTCQPLRHAVIDLPCPGWPPARVGTLLGVGIWVEQDRGGSGLQVVLLTARHTRLRRVLAEIVVTPLVPVWRVLTRAWIGAVELDLERTAVSRGRG